MMGSRTPDNEQAAEWVAATGSEASKGTFADAAAFGELLFNCTAGGGSLEALRSATEDLAGKVLIDVANPLDSSQAGWPPEQIIDLGDISSARGTEMYLPLWIRLWGALQTGYFNIRVVR